MILIARSLHPVSLKQAHTWQIALKLVGSCIFYFVHPDTKCLQEVIFYVASNNDSLLLFCATTHAIGLIQPHTSLDYLPHRASLITSSADHPKKTKSKVSVHVSRQESTLSNCTGIVLKLVISKNEILKLYSNVFNGIICFPGVPFHIQVYPSVIPKQTLADQSQYISKSLSSKTLTRCHK